MFNLSELLVIREALRDHEVILEENKEEHELKTVRRTLEKVEKEIDRIITESAKVVAEDDEPF